MSTCFLNMFYCFDVVGLTLLGKDMSNSRAFAFCHVYVLLAIFICVRSTCSCA